MSLIETAPDPSEASGQPMSSRLRSAWLGAKGGVRGVVSVIWPIAACLVPGLAITAFGLGTGYGLGFYGKLLTGIGFCFVCVFWGGIAGAAIGLIRRSRPAFGSFWKTPIRLSRTPARSGEPGQPAPPRRFWRRLRRFVGVASVVVLVIAFVLGIVAGRVVDRRLADALAAADRDDPSWQIDDVMAHRDPVPDIENSALVVADMFATLPEDWPATPEAKGPYDRIAATPDNIRLDDATAHAIGRELEGLDNAVLTGRTVADYLRGRHELELGPTLFDTRLPETQAARAAARLMVADAAIRAQDGDLDGALDSCRAILCIGRSIGDEPFLIGQIVRAAIESTSTRAIARVLGQGEPSDAALARLQTLILDEIDQPLCLFGMKGERATLVELIRRLGEGEIPISALSTGGPEWQPGQYRAKIAPWGKLLFDNQQAVALEWTTELVAIARRPAHERLSLMKAWKAEVDRVRRSRLGPFLATLPLLLSPAFEAPESALTRSQSELGATALLIAAERHRRKTGDWPATLAAIDPAILPKPPLDPYSGQPFIVDRHDGQFAIHSIGPNLKNEQGAYEPKRWGNGGADDMGTVGWDVSQRGQPPLP